MKQNRKISFKMLATILPIVTIGLAIIMFVSLTSSRELIDNQVKEEMKLNLQTEMSNIETRIQGVSNLADYISSTVGSTYKSTKLGQYETLFGELIFTDDIVLGSGIWFEPYEYDTKEKYVGPYIYKEGDKPVTTYAYSNAEYDYFAYEFYTGVLRGDGKPVFTEPYYDPELDIIMSSCSAPIYNPSGKFVGVVTVDIELTSIQGVVKAIQVGETGRGVLLNSMGQFLYLENSDNIMDKKITEDANTSFAGAGSEMLKNREGHTTYLSNDKTIHIYYDALEIMDWRLGITIDDSELTEPLLLLTKRLMTVGIIILILVFAFILLEVSTISRQIKKVKNFAVQLAAGDFTIAPLNAKRRDELGAMGTSLNEMYSSNKDIISKITEHSHILNDSSQNLYTSARRMSEQYKTIEELMGEVNMDMTSNSAATQQVNASIEEVNAAVALLSDRSVNSTGLANEIKGRASEIQVTSQQSFDQAQKLARDHKENLNTCIYKANVVSSIGEMVEVIAGIANQINLLSLNASIEAARAGEQGRGFSVVANEIGKLASDTTQAVARIQNMISDVQSAFNALLDQSKSMLSFVTDTVTPDYNMFVEVSKQYGNDADVIDEFSTTIALMVAEMENIMNEVSSAVENIAESSQHTVDNSSQIMDSVKKVSKEIVQISDMSVKQETVASDLAGVISKFTLEKNDPIPS